MVKNHHRPQQCFLEGTARKAASAKSISDASWYQFTQWLDYYGKIWDKAVVAVSPNYTSQDCSNCGHRVKKSLSTRTHSCPKCQVEICRDTNAAINILKKGMKVLGIEWQIGKCAVVFGQSIRPKTTAWSWGFRESCWREYLSSNLSSN